MTNQAAQTMPTLPRPYWKAGDVRDDYGNPYNETDLFTDDDMRAMYQQGYAAALSQTAGADVMTHFCNAIDNLNDMPVSDEWARKWAAKAEFLIGMGPDPGNQSLSDTPPAPHPDALPDGTLSKSTAKRLAAASVSERARELLAAEFEKDGLHDMATAIRAGHPNWELSLRAIEQALTQQRGHGEAVDRDAWAEALELPQGYTVEEFLPGGWHYAWTRADGERMVSGATWNHPALAAIAAWQYAPATTPQPSADAVREYDRELIARMLETPAVFEDASRREQARLLREAENLEVDARSVVRTAASGEKGVG